MSKSITVKPITVSLIEKIELSYKQIRVLRECSINKRRKYLKSTGQVLADDLCHKGLIIIAGNGLKSKTYDCYITTKGRQVLVALDFGTKEYNL